MARKSKIRTKSKRKSNYRKKKSRRSRIKTKRNSKRKRRSKTKRKSKRNSKRKRRSKTKRKRKYKSSSIDVINKLKRINKLYKDMYNVRYDLLITIYNTIGVEDEELYDYSKMTLKQLREDARERSSGISRLIKVGTSRFQIIQLLNEDDKQNNLNQQIAEMAKQVSICINIFTNALGNKEMQSQRGEKRFKKLQYFLSRLKSINVPATYNQLNEELEKQFENITGTKWEIVKKKTDILTKLNRQRIENLKDIQGFLLECLLNVFYWIEDDYNRDLFLSKNITSPPLLDKNQDYKINTFSILEQYDNLYTKLLKKLKIVIKLEY